MKKFIFRIKRFLFISSLFLILFFISTNKGFAWIDFFSTQENINYDLTKEMNHSNIIKNKDNHEDIDISMELEEFLSSNFSSISWYKYIENISYDNGIITIYTSLSEDQDAKSIAISINQEVSKWTHSHKYKLKRISILDQHDNSLSD